MYPAHAGLCGLEDVKRLESQGGTSSERLRCGVCYNVCTMLSTHHAEETRVRIEDCHLIGYRNCVPEMYTYSVLATRSYVEEQVPRHSVLATTRCIGRQCPFNDTQGQTKKATSKEHRL